MIDYVQNAKDFLRNHDAKMKIWHVTDDITGEWRRSKMTGGWLYRVSISRNGKTWSFYFSDSKYNYERNLRPAPYDVLACVEKYEPYGDEWDFAKEYGYEIHDRETYQRVKKTYKAVCKEYKNVIRMFGDCLDELMEFA